MKKSIKTICILLSVVLILFLLPSCKVQHYSESDISSWANKNIGKNVVISKDYIERPSSDEGYTDRVWTAYLKDRPDMKFEIISHEIPKDGTLYKNSIKEMFPITIRNKVKLFDKSKAFQKLSKEHNEMIDNYKKYFEGDE